MFFIFQCLQRKHSVTKANQLLFSTSDFVSQKKKRAAAMTGIIWAMFLCLLKDIYSAKTTTVHFSDLITKNVSFYSFPLSQYPSKRITIEFSIFQKLYSMEDTLTVMKLYTNNSNPNFSEECVKRYFGQLWNNYLFLPIRPGPYKDDVSCAFQGNKRTVHCTGVVTIQDFVVRHFSLAFGFLCSDVPGKNKLNGISFNITVFGQSNVTGCITTGENSNRYNPFVSLCSEYYNYISFPNLLGHQDVWQANEDMKTIDMLTSLHRAANKASFFLLNCHQNLMKSVCYVVYPKCQLENQQVIHLCKEMCQEILNACWSTTLKVVKSLPKQSFSRKKLEDLIQFPDALRSCEYLPSRTDKETLCYYEAAKCKSLPRIHNAHPINQPQDKNKTFSVHHTVVYHCNGNKSKLEGDNKVMCQYNGEWSDLPSCTEKLSLMSPTFLLLCFLLIGIPLLLLCGFTLWLLNTFERIKKARRHKRSKKYDALVSCSFDGQNDFVIKKLLPQFEEIPNPPFQLNYHERDFYLGAKIMDNIQDTIENSNSAIFLVCQKFIDSYWCREEFERCYQESKKDPDFKLFLIMMEPVEQIANLPKVMETFIKNRTYAKVEDVETFTKIAKHLRSLRANQMHNRGEEEEQQAFL